MNAKQVYELVDGCPLPERLEYVKEGYSSQMVRPHGWYFGKYPIPPAQALDLIVGACKREMGEHYRGCYRWMGSGQIEWVCEFFYRNNPDDSNFSRDGDTEPAAVIAAWRAWKEAKGEA